MKRCQHPGVNMGMSAWSQHHHNVNIFPRGHSTGRGAGSPTRGTQQRHPRGRVVREDRLGLTHARTRGIEESSGEVILFVDDDNILREDYLEKNNECEQLVADYDDLNRDYGELHDAYMQRGVLLQDCVNAWHRSQDRIRELNMDIEILIADFEAARS